MAHFFSFSTSCNYHYKKTTVLSKHQYLFSELVLKSNAMQNCYCYKNNCFVGLDLHFWRKICKNCKCTKENHDVPDDDMYGWAQFQLLGSKPNASRKFSKFCTHYF